MRVIRAHVKLTLRLKRKDAVTIDMKTTHFAEVLKEVLRESKLSQRTLALKAGVSPSGISGIIKGKRPEVETLSRLISQAGSSPETVRRLVNAHLCDEVARIGIEGPPLPASLATSTVAINNLAGLYPQLEPLFATASKVPELRDMLLSLANLASRHLARTDDRETRGVSLKNRPLTALPSKEASRQNGRKARKG